MNPFKEKVVGCLLVAGIAVILGSGLFTWLFAASGVFTGVYTREPGTDKITNPGNLNLVPLTITFALVGVVMVAGALGYGIYLNNHVDHGIAATLDQCQVIARYAMDPVGNMMTDDYQIEGCERPRFYVRLQTGAGKSTEYECARGTYDQCGEGMWGEAELKGHWLGRFTPYIGMPPADA